MRVESVADPRVYDYSGQCALTAEHADIFREAGVQHFHGSRIPERGKELVVIVQELARDDDFHRTHSFVGP